VKGGNVYGKGGTHLAQVPREDMESHCGSGLRNCNGHEDREHRDDIKNANTTTDNKLVANGTLRLQVHAPVYRVAPFHSVVDMLYAPFALAEKNSKLRRPHDVQGRYCSVSTRSYLPKTSPNPLPR
jgi:hypothetical protein